MNDETIIPGFSFLAYVVPGAFERLPAEAIPRAIDVCERALWSRIQTHYSCAVVFFMRDDGVWGFITRPLYLEPSWYSDETVIARFP